MNSNNARYVDCICTSLAIQCLSGYALSHSFIDPAYSTAMNMAYQEMNQHQRSLSRSLETAQQYNLRFNFDKTLEQARIEELRDHIHKIEDSTQGKISSRAKKSSPIIKARAKRTKRVAVKILSSRPVNKALSSLGSSPSSEEEAVEAAHLIHKRKRSSPEKKSSTTFGANFEKIASAKTTHSAPEDAKQSRLEQSKPAPRLAPSSSALSTATPSAPVSSSAPLSSGHIPNPDTDDHLTLKRLKVLHSQESKSQSHTSVQTSTSAQSIVNTQLTILSQPTVPSTIPTPLPEVMDIEDSDEEQGSGSPSQHIQ